MNTAAAKGLHASFPPLMVARSQPRSSAPFPALTLSSELRGHPPQTPATTLAVSQRLPRVLPRDPAPRRALGRLCRAIHLQTRAQANGTNAAPSPQPAAGAEQKRQRSDGSDDPGLALQRTVHPLLPPPPHHTQLPLPRSFRSFSLRKSPSNYRCLPCGSGLGATKRISGAIEMESKGWRGRAKARRHQM